LTVICQGINVETPLIPPAAEFGGISTYRNYQNPHQFNVKSAVLHIIGWFDVYERCMVNISISGKKAELLQSGHRACEKYGKRTHFFHHISNMAVMHMKKWAPNLPRRARNAVHMVARRIFKSPLERGFRGV